MNNEISPKKEKNPLVSSLKYCNSLNPQQQSVLQIGDMTQLYISSRQED